MHRRVARIAYVSWQATCVVAIAALADLWAAVLFDWPASVAAPVDMLCGLQIALSGCLVASDWRGSASRLRARQRLERRRHGPVLGWLCRDTRTWWRVSGLVVACAGAALVGIGGFLISL